MWQQAKNLYHLFEAVLANIAYGFPSKNLTVIGVTGTDGKTTTVNLIYHILKTAGCSVSMASTTGAAINGKTQDVGFHVTTPSRWQIQKFLSEAADLRGPDTALVDKPIMVLEVTSHALDQYRVTGVDFAIGVLTNVTHEHLDYHKTYDRYLATKAKLLKMAKRAVVVNKDDKSFKKISNLKFLISNDKKVITYGIKNNADITPKKFLFKSKLIGEFNTYNILAAVAVAKELGVSDSIIKKAIGTFTPPTGRQEIVYSKDFSIMIDFAHTPNAIESLLSQIKKQTKGRIIHVFGSAGQRDREKRPLMGEASDKYADVIVLTAEDPRSESVETIMDEIASGIKKKTVLKIADRKEAIARAIQMAKKNDMVVITGKGHEKSMNYGKGEESWSEHEVVKEALQ